MATVNRTRAALAILLCASCAYLLVCMRRDVSDYDEGIVLFGANRVMNGDVPHRDFYANYGPAQFYVLAALFKTFGASVAIERMWDIAVRSCLVAQIFMLSRRFCAPPIALAAASATVVFLGALVGTYGYPVFPALAAVLFGVAFLLGAARDEVKPPRVLAAGMCLGAATLFRYDIGFASLLAGSVLLALWPQFVPSRRGAGLFSMRGLWLGYGIVVLPVAVLLAIAGAIPDLIFGVVTFQAKNYGRMRALPFPTFASLRVWPMDIAVYLPFLACAAAGFALPALLRRPDPTRAASMLSLLLFTMLFIAKGLVRVSPIHMSMAIVTSFALLAALTPPIAGRGAMGRIALLACLTVAGSVAALGMASGYRTARANIVWATDAASWRMPLAWPPPAGGTCRMPAGLARLACFAVSADTANIIRFIQQRTSATDRIFVGLSRHDMIFANDVLLYFAMNRPAATKWHHFDPGLQTSLPVQRDMVRELQQAQPRYVVIESRWENAHEPNDSAKSSNVKLLTIILGIRSGRLRGSGFIAWRREGKRGSSSFLKKRTKKLLLFDGTCRSGWARQPDEQKFFGSFFQKRTASFFLPI